MPDAVHLRTLGCRLNEAELETWARGFQARGLRLVREPEAADLVVLNTCAVTADAARSSARLARHLHRRNPRARLVLSGCFAELEPDRAAALAGVDLLVGNGQKDQLVPRALDLLDSPAMPALAAEPGGSPIHALGRTRAFVKIQDGCRNRCTFCVVTVARGDERSRPIDALVDEVNALHAQGHLEVVLTGVHIGGYGADLGVGLPDLLDALLARTAVPRLRLGSLEPWDLGPALFERWADPRLCPHLHLPLQSGCDAVLRRMARRCDARSYAALVDAARARVPDLVVTTDLIVGFPGETEAEHRASMDVVAAVGFGDVHVFAYSPRAGTAAARMAGQVPQATRAARSREAHALAARMKARTLAAAVGQTRPVLWERHAPEAGRVRGYTDHYLRVEAAAGPALARTLTPARLVAVEGQVLRALPEPPARVAPPR